MLLRKQEGGNKNKRGGEIGTLRSKSKRAIIFPKCEYYGIFVFLLFVVCMCASLKNTID